MRHEPHALGHFIRPNRPHKFSVDGKAPASINDLDAPAAPGNPHVAFSIRNLRVAMPHVHTHVARRAAHFNIPVSVIDGHRRGQVRHADVALLAVNRHRRLFRHGNVHVHADSRASASSEARTTMSPRPPRTVTRAFAGTGLGATSMLLANASCPGKSKSPMPGKCCRA